MPQGLERGAGVPVGGVANRDAENRAVSEPVDQEQAVGSIWASIGFWLTVFAATALLASVVLAPRLERVQRLRDELTRITADCARLDRQNERLARFLRALQHDPSLVRQLAEWELKGRPASEAPAFLVDDPVPSTDSRSGSHSLWRRILHVLATDPAVERAAYLATAGLYLIALTCFRSPLPSRTVGRRSAFPPDHTSESVEDSVVTTSPPESDDMCLFG